MVAKTFDEVLSILERSVNLSFTSKVCISDWSALFQELCSQTVSAIPMDVLAPLIPKEEKLRLIQIASAHIMNMQKHLRAQDALVRLFTGHNIEFVILKGLTVAKYYPQPEYRTLGDVDIAVLHKDYKAAYEIMVENGYREVDCPYEKHSEFEKDGIIFELHKYFTSANDLVTANYIEDCIQNGIKNRIDCELEGYHFPKLPPMAEGIMLLEHMSQHLEAGIGLRHMLDWMLYASHNIDDQIWESTFANVAEQAGLRKLAEVSTKLCKKYLGLSGISWCDQSDETSCDTLIEHIALRGNFGANLKKTDNKTRKLLCNNHGLSDWFNYLQATGLRTIPFVRKHKVLRPFAWLFRAVVLLCQLIKNNGLIGIVKEKENADKLDAFLDDLGIRRVRRGHTFWDGEHFIKKKY